MRAVVGLLAMIAVGMWAQSVPTAQQVMQQLVQRANTVRSYAYQWEFQERDEKTGKLGEKQVYKLEFLKPHYRKLTIIQRDLFSNGAVLIYNPDEDSKVHARRGIIRRSYEKNDPEIARFFETDLDYIVRDLQRLFRGAQAEPVRSVTVNGRNGWQVVFRPRADTIQRVVLVIDARDSMPLRIEYHDAKGLRSVRVFTEYSFPNLKTDDFKF